MPAGAQKIVFFVKGFPYYARRGQNFGFFCKRVPLLCPQGPNFWIFVVKEFPYYARRGQQIKKIESQKALNHVLTF